MLAIMVDPSVDYGQARRSLQGSKDIRHAGNRTPPVVED